MMKVTIFVSDKFKISTLALIIFLIVSLILLTGCSSKYRQAMVFTPPAIQSESIVFETIEVKKTDFEHKINVNAEFVSGLHQEVYFKSSGGRIRKIYVHTGDDVKAGDIIAELDTESLQSRMRQQEILYRMAQIDYETLKENGANKNNLEKAALNTESVRLELDQIKKNLEESKLTAPITGKISYVLDIKEGMSVGAYITIASIIDPKSIMLKYLDESELKENIDLFFKGRSVDVTIKNESYKGVVVTGPQDIPENSNYEKPYYTLIKIDNLPASVLPGDSAEVSLTDKRYRDVFQLPKKVVKNINGRMLVKVLKNNMPVEQEIFPVFEDGSIVVVSSGMHEGDLVISD